MKELRVIFGTDFHGSEVCFRKLFNLSARTKADVIVIGGDLCGKGMVPLIGDNGTYEGRFNDEPFTVSTSEEIEEVEKRIRFNGLYPLRCTREEFEAMIEDQALRDETMSREMVRSIERWIDIGEEKLAGSHAVCVSLPGNDDEKAIDAALNRSSRIRNCDARIIESEHVQIIGLGASNATPWNSPREFSEEELSGRLKRALDDADPDRPMIANIHVPPFRSTLDDAPLVDEELRPVVKGGNPMIGPVGSTAVRQFIESTQPCLSLHGHIHECRRSTWIGNTQALNPGSDYSSGTLQAALVTIDLKKRRAKRCQFVSG